MNKHALPVLAVAALALAGCGSPGGSYGAGGSGGASTPASTPVATSGPALSLASTDLGRVLVDSSGRTLYYYDKDTPGETTSACTGPCVGLWPAVPGDPHAKLGPGVHGTVGTVRTAAGGSQLTFDGHPLYTYASDQKAGDTYGQGYDGIWWVVGGDGTRLTSAPASGSTSGSSSAGGGGYGGGY